MDELQPTGRLARGAGMENEAHWTRRRSVLVAAIAAVIAAGGGAALIWLPRDDTPDELPWTGGPVTPSPIAITINPSALPVGDTVPTGIIVDGLELVLYFWGTPRPNLGTAWREVASGRVTEDGGWVSSASLDSRESGFRELHQIELRDGTLVELGVYPKPVGRIVCVDRGRTVAARFTSWSADPTVTIFWLHRRGEPVPDNTPTGIGRTVPLAPELYPMISAFDAEDRLLAETRLRPPGTAQRGG